LIRKDFHTHTYRCKHAEGDVPDFVARARELGLEALGLSDHMPYPGDRWPNFRMDYAPLDGLVTVMHAARATPDLRVYAGLECEWVPEYRAYYEDELFGKHRLDYLIGSTHFTPVGGQWLSSFDALTTTAHLRAYVDHTIALMDTGLFAFVAHPDVFAQCFHRWTPDVAAASRDLFQAAKARNGILELNASGYRKTPFTYPWRPFWETAAEHGVRVVINSDAHSPGDLFAAVPRAYELAAELQLDVVDLETCLQAR
jgi:histidinol-phosphatase (PHP family)